MIIYAATTKVLVPLFGLPAAGGPVGVRGPGAGDRDLHVDGRAEGGSVYRRGANPILFGSAILVVVFVTCSLGGVGQWWPAHWPEQWPAPKLYDSDRPHRLSHGRDGRVRVARFDGGFGPDRHPALPVNRDAKTARTVLITTLVADSVIGVILVTVGLGLWGYLPTPTCYPTAARSWPTPTACCRGSSWSVFPWD